MKLNTVWKWWDRRRVGLCKMFTVEGVEIRPVSFDDLSDDEQEIVYHYWLHGELIKKQPERK